MPRAATASQIIDLATRRPRRAPPRTPTQPVAADIATELETFLNARRALNRSPRTLAAYAEAVRLLEAFLRGRGHSLNVANVSRRDIDDFLVSERERKTKHGRPLSPVSIAIRYRAIRAFFRFLAGLDKQGRSTGDAVIDASSVTGEEPKTPASDVPIVTDDDLRHLIRSIEKDRSFDGRRDLAIITMFLDTGIRLGEMTAIQMDDLDLAHDQVVVRGKTGERTVPFNPSTRAKLDRYLRIRQAHGDHAKPDLWLGRRGPLQDQA